MKREISARRAAIWLTCLAVSPAMGQLIASEIVISRAPASAKQLVTDALQAEADGNLAKRRVLLSVAIDAEPNFAPARWQSGQINIEGEWLGVEAAQQVAAENPARVEYGVLRKEAGDSVLDQLALARWCDQHSMKDEAKFHWSNVLAYQPYNEEALRATDSCWYEGQRMTVAEAKAAQTEALARRRAAQEYRPKIARWTRKLEAGDLRSRDAVLAEIRAFRNFVALPAMEDVTLNSHLETNAEFERAQQFGLAIVDALAKVPSQVATDSLLRHAAVAPVKSVRDAAGEALQRRSPHGYVPQLLLLLSMPFESSFRMTTDSEGGVHYWHSLYREGRDANLSIETRNSLVQHDFHGATVFVGANGPLGFEKESDSVVARRKSQTAQQSQTVFANLAADREKQVAQVNAETNSTNSRVTTLLANVTDQDLGDSPRAWWDWWDKYNEYASDDERPTREQRYVNTQHEYHRLPEYVPVASTPHSCFAAGTMIWTKVGLQAIETLEIGDFVLAQNTDTGELSYRTVLGRTVRRDRPTLLVQCGSETIQATLGHPMWVAGKGWKMAKELQPGDMLHGVKGPTLVDSVEAAESIDVFNLVVEDAHNYFVGAAGVLVHDNSPRGPVETVVPGLNAATE